MNKIKGLIAAAVTLALLAIPAGALAKSRDGDHDRMPDKWEKAHHLNPHAKDARKDADHDGLVNISEFRHHTDPQKADTDNDGVDDNNELRDHTSPNKDDSDGDGIKDGDEVSGTIVAFDANKLLTIQLPGDGAPTVAATVNDATQIECDSDSDAAAPPAATTSRDGSDDGANHDAGDDHGSAGGTTTTPAPAGTPGSDDGANHDAGDDDSANACTAADLKQGARVHEAKLTTAPDGSKVFTKIELVPAV
jgi:hypothetical protein